MALAIMVRTRLWLAGEVSAQRDMPLIRRLMERVRACAFQRPLLCCTDGLCSYIRAIRVTFRDPVRTGAHGRPRLRPWRNVCIAQVVKRYVQRWVVDVERRIVDGTPVRVETLRRRSQGGCVINTAYIERLNATSLSYRRREIPAVQVQADAVLALATAHGFPNWVGVATFYRGWALAMQGQAAAGLPQMHQGLAGAVATGTLLGRPRFLVHLAEALGHTGQVAAGLRLLAEALAEFEAGGQGHLLAEAYRQSTRPQP